MKISPHWLSWPQTQALLNAFEQMPLRFVGGSVRDALLNREVQDVDAATPLLPEQVMELLGKSQIKVIPTGIDHGTVTAIISPHQFEITTLRRDVATDGRRAIVAYTQDWKEDAARRDFTMNALYCDRHGELYDYFGGTQDAQNGQVRFIGDATTRIAEDALRILRFFRFFAHYGQGEIDAQGLQACAASAAKVDNLSGERIEQEMMKLLVAKNAGDLIGLMQQQQILPHIISHPVNTQALSALPQVLRSAGHAPDALLSLACLLRSNAGGAGPAIDAIDARWKLSKADYRKLQELCKPLIAGVTWADEKKIKKHLRALGKELFIQQILLLMAEGSDTLGGLKAIEFALGWTIPEFPVTGNDLLAMGFVPGRKLGAHLAMLENYWEEQGYGLDKEQLLMRLSVK